MVRRTPTAQNISPGILTQKKNLGYLFSFSLCLPHANTHRQREIRNTPPPPTFSTATIRWYALKPWVHTERRYMPGAPMQHRETPQRAAGGLHFLTLCWGFVSKLTQPGQFYLVLIDRDRSRQSQLILQILDIKHMCIVRSLHSKTLAFTALFF